MKKIIVAISISISCLFVTGCKDKEEKSRIDKKNEISVTGVPTPVQTAFTTAYPGVTDVVWENAHENDMKTFKVKFKKDGKDWKAEYSENGQLIKEKADD